MSTLRALFTLSRPRMAPFLWLLVLGGYGFAHWDRALLGQGLPTLLLVLVAWTSLHAGTLWLNAALDRDEGEVMWGSAAEVPDSIYAWSAAALRGCVGIASLAGPVIGGCAVGASLLAVLYSHPATVWKGHAVLGPVVNGVGYGVLTPIAGFSAAGVAPTMRSGVVLVIGLGGVMAAYYAAQAFQGEEDRERGYRTLVATHGLAGAVWAVRVCVWTGFLCALTLAVVGWVPRPLLVLAPAVLWLDRYLARWQGSGEEADSDWAKGFASRLLAAALLGLAVLVGVYLDDSMHDRPVAGLGTAAGHPPDRPLLAPAQMRQWEARQAVLRASQELPGR